MSRLLPSRTLGVHRKVSEDNLPDRLVTFVITQTKGDGGMVLPGMPVEGDRYPCRMVLASEAEETSRADGLALNARWVIVVPYAANVRVGNQLTVTGPNWSRTVEVVGTNTPRSFATLRRVFASDVFVGVPRSRSRLLAESGTPLLFENGSTFLMEESYDRQ